VLGTELVVQTGVCGGLADGMLAGDLVIPREAGCGDGASQCYLPGRERVTASRDLSARTMPSHTGPPTLHDGPIWTTAALLAEGVSEVNAWHEAGYVAVDLETAATFSVAEYFGMKRISILTVFDNPRHGTHLALSETEKQHARSRGEVDALELVLGFATGAL
jgi:uridine phosphorylase